MLPIDKTTLLIYTKLDNVVKWKVIQYEKYDKKWNMQTEKSKKETYQRDELKYQGLSVSSEKEIISTKQEQNDSKKIQNTLEKAFDR